MAIIGGIPTAMRQKGEHTAEFTAPTDLTGNFKVIADMLISDMENTALHIECSINWLNGAIWQHYVGFTFDGGVRTGKDGGLQPPPSVTVNGTFLAGKQIQIVLNLSEKIRIGADIETV